MTYWTRRRLKRELVRLRHELAHDRQVYLEAARKALIRDTKLAEKNVRLTDRVAELEAHNANLRAQLDARDARTTDTREHGPVDPEQLIAEVQALSKPRGQR